MTLLGSVASGDSIDPSWGNTIRNQTVQVTTSGARPGTPTEGMVIYETDTDTVQAYDGTTWREIARTGQWTDVAAGSITIAQGASSNISKTITYAAYRRLGRSLRWQGLAAMTGAGTASGVVSVTLPFATRAAAAGMIRSIGNAHVFDTSAGTYHGGFAVPASTTTLQIVGSNSAGVSNYLGAVGFTAAIASGDAVGWDVEVELA